MLVSSGSSLHSVATECGCKRGDQNVQARAADQHHHPPQEGDHNCGSVSQPRNFSFFFFPLGEFELSHCILSVGQASKNWVVISARFKKINKRAIYSQCFCLSLTYQKCFVRTVLKKWWSIGSILINIRLWTETVFWEACGTTYLVDWKFHVHTYSLWEMRFLTRGELWTLAVPLPSLVHLHAFLTKILRFSLKIDFYILKGNLLQSENTPQTGMLRCLHAAATDGLQ